MKLSESYDNNEPYDQWYEEVRHYTVVINPLIFKILKYTYLYGGVDM